MFVSSSLPLRWCVNLDPDQKCNTSNVRIYSCYIIEFTILAGNFQRLLLVFKTSYSVVVLKHASTCAGTAATLHSRSTN